MAIDLKSLRAERAKLIHDARAIVDAAEAQSRALTDEENAKFGELMDAADERKAKIDREEKLRAVEGELASREERAESTKEDRDAPDAMRGFRSWLATGRARGEDGEALRSLSAQTNTEGGYLVAPEQFVTQLIKFVDDLVFIRGLATVYSVPNAVSLGAPELTADPADSDWTTELQTGSEDSTMAFGKRSIEPHPLAKRIKVSRKLLQVSQMPVEQLVMQRMAYKFAITEEKAFMTGTGNQQPLGLFTASSNGISTARDVSTGNTTTAMTVDGLKEAKYSLKAQYMANSTWIFHRDGMKQIAKLKDGEGQYLWQDAVREGEPDRLLGRPVIMSEFAPNTFTTGLYVGMIGDFSHYWIVDALDMQMQRLEELYAESNQVGFIARRELDGAPTLAEAFARVTLA